MSSTAVTAVSLFRLKLKKNRRALLTVCFDINFSALTCSPLHISKWFSALNRDPITFIIRRLPTELPHLIVNIPRDVFCTDRMGKRFQEIFEVSYVILELVASGFLAHPRLQQPGNMKREVTVRESITGLTISIP